MITMPCEYLFTILFKTIKLAYAPYSPFEDITAICHHERQTT